MFTLADGYPIEQKRCRELLQIYHDLGQPGLFGHTMIEQTLARADKAAAEQDLPAMIAAYQDMKACC